MWPTIVILSLAAWLVLRHGITLGRRSLMIYVGTVGSASFGALPLFLFYVGMVPHVLSAPPLVARSADFDLASARGSGVALVPPS